VGSADLSNFGSFFQELNSVPMILILELTAMIRDDSALPRVVFLDVGIHTIQQ
jgi:hypothetical protein